MGDWQNFDNRAVIGRALRLRREIDEFEARWPDPAPREEVRELQVRSRAWLGRNELSPLARLGVIVGIAIFTAIAFGGMLAGLRALTDLGRVFYRA
jgi:hypothetical protein